MKPIISVIIPVYNAFDTISVAINSVWECIGNNGELIIVDGYSTDGTRSLLNQFDSASNIQWTSEPDDGIYDAMNKGIERASGDWFYFLGADDRLIYRELPDLVKQIPADYCAVFGNVQFENGHIMRSYLSDRTWFQNTVHHQSALYHRSIFDSFRYDESLKLLADYELNLYIHSQSLRTLYVDKLIAICNSRGASSNLSESVKETNLVRGRFIKSSWKQMLFSLLLTLYYSQKQIRRKLYGHRV